MKERRGYLLIQNGKLSVRDLSTAFDRCLEVVDLPVNLTDAQADAIAARLTATEKKHGIAGYSCSSTIDFPEDAGSSREAVAKVFARMGWAR